jgi:hypothetical protein
MVLLIFCYSVSYKGTGMDEQLSGLGNKGPREHNNSIRQFCDPLHTQGHGGQ